MLPDIMIETERETEKYTDTSKITSRIWNNYCYLDYNFPNV